MQITRTCPFTGKTNTLQMPVTEAQMHEYMSPNRRNIQNIFPNLDADDREFIQTGIMPDQWPDQNPRRGLMRVRVLKLTSRNLE